MAVKIAVIYDIQLSLESFLHNFEIQGSDNSLGGKSNWEKPSRMEYKHPYENKVG